MISHDILKRAATAGAVGAAVLGGAVWTMSESASPECPSDASEWGQPAEVAYVPPEEYSPPEVRRAPRPDESSAESDSDEMEETEAELRARKDAMERAIERLARIKREKRRGESQLSDATVRRLEARIDRAIRTAVERSERE